MLSLLRFYKPYRRLLIIAVICNLLMSAFLIVSIPILQPFLQILFDADRLAKAQPPAQGSWSFAQTEQQINWFFAQLINNHGREQALLLMCGVIVATFFGKNLFRYLSMYFLGPVRNGIVRDMRRQLTDKMLALPLSWFSNERKGDLMSRISSDVQEVEWSIVGVIESVAREPIVLLGSLLFMVVVSPQLLAFVLVLMLVAGLIIGGIGQRLRKQSGEAQGRMGQLISIAEEMLGGLRIIKGFNAESWQQRRFAVENEAYTRGMIQMLRRKDLASPLSEFLGVTIVAILLWFGSRQVFSGQMTTATFITFLYAFYNIIEPAKALTAASYSIRKGMGALERIKAILDTPITLTEVDQPVDIQAFQHKVEFKNVSFFYDNSDTAAVKNIDLTIEKGKMVALVGASGAGKSTIADLLPRFYDVSAGQITIDGVDIRQMRISDLRDLMGIVSQEAILFNDSIRNNIAFGMEQIPMAEVEAAARAANAHDFIMALPNGYNSNIGDRGNKLSGGQRQRLTIARALLKNPAILILDEATSALDSESEQLVQAALDRLLQNRTALVIAHRLSTIQHADEIIVLDGGGIVERGAHADLLGKDGFYKKLVGLQGLL